MYKYYAIDSGKEVKVGDVISLTASDYPASLTIKMQDEEDLNLLVTHGMLIMKEEKEKPKRENKPVSITYERAIERIADRVGWKKEKVAGYLNSLKNINPVAALTTVMHELAKEADRNYLDHISNVERVWVFNHINNRTIALENSQKRLNFKTFAAFRTLSDLTEALSVCAPFLDRIYEYK